MSFLTATVPVFSEEEERAERESLSADEKKLLRAEIHGDETLASPNGPEPSDAVIDLEKAESLLREATASLPMKDKAAYLEALKLVPELVQQETPSLPFLQCEGFDPWAAAMRLCQYWTLRRRLFGEELAFLPMTQNGAMRHDIELLHRQVFVLPLPSDASGRPVALWDRIRASEEQKDAVFRCLFYACSRLSKHDNFSTKGWIAVLNYQGCNLRKHYDRTVTKHTVALLNAFPGKTKAVHFCTGPGKSVTGLLLPVLKQISGRDYRLRFVVQAGSRGDVLARFPDYGLNVEHVDALYGSIEERRALTLKWALEEREKELGGDDDTARSSSSDLLALWEQHGRV